MSNPTPPPAQSAPEESQPFDLLAFWLQYKSSIQTVGVLAAIGIFAYGIREWRAHARYDAAAEAFATAKTPEQLAGFIRAHHDSALSGNAAILISEKQRSEKKWDESIQTLRAFLAQSPTHPLAAAAKLGVASAQEAQGKTEEALASYRALASSDMTGFATPAAWLRIARILKSQGKIEEAKTAYETLQGQFPKSYFAVDALQETQELIPKSVPKADGQNADPKPASEVSPEPSPASGEKK